MLSGIVLHWIHCTFCRVYLCRGHVWGFHTSGTPSYSSQLACWHSRVWVIVLNPSNPGKEENMTTNSDIQHSGRGGGCSSFPPAESYTHCPTTCHVCGGVQQIPHCIRTPLSVGTSGLCHFVCVAEDPGILADGLWLMLCCAAIPATTTVKRNKCNPELSNFFQLVSCFSFLERLHQFHIFPKCVYYLRSFAE